MPALRTRDTQSRALDVSTDVPSPTVAISSPTPRAFTFPVNHNLSDSPYSTPSTSPFQPESEPLSTTSALPTTLFNPESSTSVLCSPPEPLTHSRRQSASSLHEPERRPKKGDEGYVKRPENAFILFRRKCCEDRQAAQEGTATSNPMKKQRQADLSKTISQQWKALSDEERKYWDQLAKERKKEHEALHPGYVYRPQRVKESRARARKGKGMRGDIESDPDCMSFVMPMTVSRSHERPVSVPTPPPSYQSVHVPNMYITPSSPSLKQLIEHSSARPGEAMMTFDYQPQQNVAPTTFAGYEGLMPSEFLQNNRMFNVSGSGDAGSLTMSPEDLVLPQQSSPASSISSASSGPSSPCSDHYTPLTNSLANAYTQLDQHGCIDPQTQAEIDIQINLQQQDLDEYNPYGWENTVWPAGSETLVNDDFDINAIPQLDVNLKYGSDADVSSAISEYSQDLLQDFVGEYPQDLSQERFIQTLAGPVYATEPYEDSMHFDDMMPHGF